MEVKESRGRRVVLEVKFSCPIAYRRHPDSDDPLEIDLIDTLYITGGVSEIRLGQVLKKEFRFGKVIIGESHQDYP